MTQETTLKVKVHKTLKVKDLILLPYTSLGGPLRSVLNIVTKRIRHCDINFCLNSLVGIA